MKRVLRFSGHRLLGQAMLVGAALLASTAAVAANYSLDSANSSVSFATIKKQYVVEPATLTGMSGSYKGGQFEFSIPLSSVSTGVQIRDMRLNQLFFESQKFPAVKVSGQFNTKTMAKDGVLSAKIPAKVTLFGQTKQIMFPVTVLKAGQFMQVSSSAPVIINAADFGIPAENLKRLSATVGGIPLSDKVPVDINLIFRQR
ncbi:hypothetical protein NFHSH190041_15040 [Shewanella sp. NFH-SH190041]|uniref:YceI family protein n=1 Tax=Shewanella sp. NFH-SH190041 TaxID=2950245 RepID=UPI0021C484A9|nr:YceI family protein [Shewanella sp. NFH-SH190041]BDM64052.1 hypothetical protein NFHSH190041_15040 [Shewanella sp. NFH-SH190041]